MLMKRLYLHPARKPHVYEGDPPGIPSAVELAMAHDAIAGVTQSYLDLGYLGFRVVEEGYNFSADREELLGKGAAEAFTYAMAWLRHVPRRRNFPRSDSYAAKEEAEKWSEQYIANGPFIAAAVYSGFRVERSSYGRNARIAYSARSKWPRRTSEM